MPSLGAPELIIILLIVIAVFGAGKLANLGGALGKGVKDFKSAMQDPNAKPENDQVITPNSEGENSGENQN
jgi:sec-independent protein translocase protein TatA